MKCIIAGPRNYMNRAFVFATLDKVFSRVKPDLIIEGGATGVDEWAKQYAAMHGIPVHEELANWADYGKPAGPIRNKIMAGMATHAVIFLNEHKPSPGSKNMAEAAKEFGLVTKIIPI